jgi:hypothetical protein
MGELDAEVISVVKAHRKNQVRGRLTDVSLLVYVLLDA